MLSIGNLEIIIYLSPILMLIFALESFPFLWSCEFCFSFLEWEYDLYYLSAYFEYPKGI